MATRARHVARWFRYFLQADEEVAVGAMAGGNDLAELMRASTASGRKSSSPLHATSRGSGGSACHSSTEMDCGNPPTLVGSFGGTGV